MSVGNVGGAKPQRSIQNNQDVQDVPKDFTTGGANLQDVMDGANMLEGGTTGQGVQLLQQVLQGMGALPGNNFQPGVMDNATQNAVKQFQAQHGITVDGKVGPETLGAMLGGGSVENADAAARRLSAGKTVGGDTASRAPQQGDVPAAGSERAANLSRSDAQRRMVESANRGVPPSPLEGSKPLKTREFSGGGDIRAVKNDAGHVDAFSFKAKMAIDSDGASNVTANRPKAKAEGLIHDPDYQAETSLKWKGGKSVDASKVPFVVLPPDLQKASGAKQGDLVKVDYNGRSTFGIVADTGPKTKLGEGSMALAKSLGMNDSPTRGGVDSAKVRYTVLPGSGETHGIKQGGPAHTFEDIQKKGALAFGNAEKAGILKPGTVTPQVDTSTTPAATTPAATTPAATTPTATTPTAPSKDVAATTPKPDAAGKDVKLNVPWYSQFDSKHVPDAGKSACYRAARAMSKAFGVDIPASTANRIQVATGEDSKGRVNVDKAALTNARSYIDAQLDAGKPVTVGVSHKDATYNADGITDHFVVITGRGTDASGKPFYTYNDPATGDATKGQNNRFYADDKGNLVHSGAVASGYVRDRHTEMSMVIRNQ